MLDHIHFLVLFGTIPLICGVGMAIWPRAMLEMSKEDDGQPVPVTPSNICWTRILGIAFVALGIVSIAAGIMGVEGTDGPVMF